MSLLTSPFTRAKPKVQSSSPQNFDERDPDSGSSSKNSSRSKTSSNNGGPMDFSDQCMTENCVDLATPSIPCSDALQFDRYGKPAADTVTYPTDLIAISWVVFLHVSKVQSSSLIVPPGHMAWPRRVVEPWRFPACVRCLPGVRGRSKLRIGSLLSNAVITC